MLRRSNVPFDRSGNAEGRISMRTPSANSGLPGRARPRPAGDPRGAHPERPLLIAPARRSASDGWLGAREFPGYRAGNVVARLDDLPEVYPDHLYFHLVLLDSTGQFQDNHSGPCYALARRESTDVRSRFVRVVAELVRHAPSEDRGLTAIGRALTLIRERGVETEALRLAAQLLDDACSEAAVVASLVDLLELTLGPDEALRSMAEVVGGLARDSGFGALSGGEFDEPVPADFDGALGRVNDGGLGAQVAFVAATVGKAQARRYLRRAIDFELVPLPHMLGV